MLLLRNLALGLYLIERLLAEVYWLQAQSQDPLEQKVRPLVCMLNSKWSCMSLPHSWDLQVPWFGSMREWHVNPLLFSLSSLQTTIGYWQSCKWRLSCFLVVFFLFSFSFFKILFIYSWEREREAETQAQGEAGSTQGTRCGIWSWDPGSSPASGSLQEACFFLGLCLCLSLSLSWINKWI